MTDQRITATPIDPVKLDRLAEVAVKVGLGLRPGQDLLLTAPAIALPLVRRIAVHAYKAGAGNKKFRDNIEAARALGATDDQLRQIEAARDKQEQQLRDAEAERLKQLQNSLDSREAAAKGLTDEAAAIARRAQEEKELFDAQQQGYSDAQIAQLKYIQGLEDAAAAQEKATAIQRQQEDLNVRALRAQGQSAQADALAFQYQQAREMADAIKAGTDPLTLALLANTQQLEAVAFAAQQLQASMQQARSDIQRDVQLGLTTPQGGLAAEQQAFGFGGLTVDQIKALYTPYSGTALTTDQETLNNNIAQFLQDYQALNSANSPAATLSQQASGQGERTAITNAAQTLTSAQGNRMADYLATLVTYEREELEIKRQERAGGSAVPIAPSGNGSTLADIASAATAAATKAVASAVLTTNTGGLSISVTAPIRQTVDLSDPAARRAIVQQVADDLDQLLERRAKDAQLRSGSTLKTGF